ncbi:MAG: hypothetical protein IH991_25805 [Planctomycetes bacterium]|nr:hypothetical protein [Planctomycetota bacterium]
MQDVIDTRFFARGDRRIGFYTLMLSAGGWWSNGEMDDVGRSKLRSVRRDPLADHPDSTLARYIAWEYEAARDSKKRLNPPLFEHGANPFISQLSKFRQMYLNVFQHRVAQLPGGFDGPPVKRETKEDIKKITDEELDDVFDFILNCRSPIFASQLLTAVQQMQTEKPIHSRIAAAVKRLEDDGILNYDASYRLATSLAKTGKRDEARQMFLRLYREALRRGVLPPIDKTFRDVLLNDKAVEESGENETPDPFADVFIPRSSAFRYPFEDDAVPNPYGNGKATPSLAVLLRETCRQLVEQRRRTAAMTLVWQCYHLKEHGLARELLNLVLDKVPAEQHLTITMRAIDFLAHTGHYDWAEELLDELISDSRHAEIPALWRLASWIASRRGQLARSIRFHEKAIDIEYNNLSGVINVEEIRREYSQLLERFQHLASTMKTLDQKPTDELLARVVRTADRWRSLDNDATLACQSAAVALQSLGQQELAWDYLTTPLALKPAEAAPWIDLAKTLHLNGNLELANRAYSAAFGAEPTNAEILWNHAQMLEGFGRVERAYHIYHQITEGKWQERFEWIRRAAKRRVAHDEP